MVGHLRQPVTQLLNSEESVMQENSEKYIVGIDPGADDSGVVVMQTDGKMISFYLDPEVVEQMNKAIHEWALATAMAWSAAMESLSEAMRNFPTISTEPGHDWFNPSDEFIEQFDQFKKRPARQAIAPDPRMSRGKGGKLRWRRK